MVKTSKFLKILAGIMLVILLVLTVTPVFASSYNYGTDITNMNGGSSAINNNNIGNAIKKVVATIRNVAVIAAVITILVIGVKYITGSVEQKAEYKKTMIPLVVGVIIVVFATQIATMLFNMGG